MFKKERGVFNSAGRILGDFHKEHLLCDVIGFIIGEVYLYST